MIGETREQRYERQQNALADHYARLERMERFYVDEPKGEDMSKTLTPIRNADAKVRRTWKSDGTINVMPLDHAAALLGTVLNQDSDTLYERLAMGQVIQTHQAGYQLVMGDKS